MLSYETIRAWVGKFAAQIAKRVRAARSRPTDKWHVDEVVIMINGVRHWLWRAVDSNGEVLDIFVQSRRNARAAKRFISRLITHWGEPRVIVTDKLRSYGAALRKLGLNVDHRAHKELNNRIEGSHRPTRKRKKIQGRFKSARQAQRFLSVHDETANLFRPRRRIRALERLHERHGRVTGGGPASFDPGQQFDNPPAPLTALRSRHSQSSPARHGRMERCNHRPLKTAPHIQSRPDLVNVTAHSQTRPSCNASIV